MKKALILASLSLALITSACGAKDKASTNVSQNTKKPSKEATQVKAPEARTEEDSLGDYTTREGIRKLMTQSDYISRVKLTQLGDGQTELTILDNYKGSLSNIEFPQPKKLSTNKEYLIFYKDDAEGNIVPTASDAVVEVATKNDTILDYVEGTYNKSKDQGKSTTSKSSSSRTKDQASSSQDTTSSKSSSSSKEDQDKTTSKTSSRSTKGDTDKTSRGSKQSNSQVPSSQSTTKVKRTTKTSSKDNA